MVNATTGNCKMNQIQPFNITFGLKADRVGSAIPWKVIK